MPCPVQNTLEIALSVGSDNLWLVHVPAKPIQKSQIGCIVTIRSMLFISLSRT